jgi:hypothetical protein
LVRGLEEAEDAASDEAAAVSTTTDAADNLVDLFAAAAAFFMARLRMNSAASMHMSAVANSMTVPESSRLLIGVAIGRPPTFAEEPAEAEEPLGVPEAEELLVE